MHRVNEICADVDNLRQDLSRLTWSSCPTIDRLFDRQVQRWTSSLVDALLRNVPRRTVRVNPGSKPWYNSHLQHLVKCRDHLFRRSRKLDPSSKTAVAYRMIRNLYVSELRAAERTYFRNLVAVVTDRKLDPRHWWKKAKKVCGWATQREVPPLSVGDKLITCPQEKAVVFNAHFCLQCSTYSPAAFPSCSLLLKSSSVAKPGFQFSSVSSCGFATPFSSIR